MSKEIDSSGVELSSRDEALGTLATLSCEMLSEFEHGHPQRAREALKRIGLVIESAAEAAWPGARHATRLSDFWSPIPVRTRVTDWKLGLCKRCMRNDVRDGDVVVRIRGLGWWHDECYRFVDPKY